jgi:hypothetical protein
VEFVDDVLYVSCGSVFAQSALEREQREVGALQERVDVGGIGR